MDSWPPSDTFNIGQQDFDRARSLWSRITGTSGRHTLLYINAAVENNFRLAKHLHAHGLEGELRVLHLPSVNLYVMRYTGQDEVTLNGHRMGRTVHTYWQWQQRAPT